MRSLAALVALGIAAGLTALVVTVGLGVRSGLRGATAVDLLETEVVVEARSAAGLDPSVLDTARRAVPGADLFPVVRVDTRIVEEEPGDPLPVLGLDAEASQLLRDVEPAELVTAEPAEGTAGMLVGEQWARGRGLAPGQVIQLASSEGTSRWTVTGFLPGSLPNDGAIAVADREQVGDVFGRGSRLDYILVQGSGLSPERITDELDSALGDVALVGSPDEVVAPEIGSFQMVQTAVVAVVLIALGTAGLVVFICWKQVLDDDRPWIARLRLIGAAPRALAAGSALPVGGAALATGLVGGVAGTYGGKLLGTVADQITGLTGLAARVQVEPEPLAVVAAVGLTVLLAVGAWALSLRALLQTPPIEAIRSPSGRPRSMRSLVWAAVAGLGLVAGAEWVASRSAQPAAAGLSIAAGLVGGGLTAVVALRLLGGLLARRGRWNGLVAGRQAAGARSSTAMVVSVFAVASITATALFGIAASVNQALDRSVAAWTRGDYLMVAGEQGAAMRDQRFPADLAERVQAAEGVRHAVPFGYLTTVIGGRAVLLSAFETEDLAATSDLVDLQVLRGPRGSDLWRALDDGGVALSADLAKRLAVEVGDRVTLPGDRAGRSFPVSAIVTDATSDGGIVFLSFDQLRQTIGEDRPYEFLVRAEPGESTTALRSLEALAEPFPTAEVVTGSEMRRIVLDLAAQLVLVIQLLGLASFGLALLVAVATAASALAARRETLGRSRLFGSSLGDLRRQLRLEALLVGGAAVAVGVPVGMLAVRWGLVLVSSQSGFVPSRVLPGGSVVVAALVTVAAAVAAHTLAGRGVLRMGIVDMIREE